MSAADFDYAELFADLEGVISSDEEPELERDLSINEWIERVRGALMEAQQHARTGETVLEERAWVMAASIAVRRCRVIRELERSG